MRQSKLIKLLCFALSIASVDCYGGTPRQKAVAAVVVAIAQIQVADEKPQLSDTTNRFSRSANPTQSDSTPTVMSMSVTPIESGPASDAIPAQLIIESWERGCSNCVRLERALIGELRPLGWTLGNSLSDQIRFTTIPQTSPAPHIRLMQRGVQIKEWSGYQDPSSLSNELRKAWDDADQRPSSIQATGAAGSIKASSQIRKVKAWFRDRIGEGVKAEMRWDRSGAQSFPLLAKGDWSALALFGGYGHMQLSAKGAKDLPIESLGFGYRVNGKDITFDIDPLTIQGLATQLGVTDSSRSADSTSPAFSSSQPAGFGLMTVWTVFSIVRDVWSLLHPSCDLLLGGNVTATAILQGDVITIDFQQCPSIKLVALFTFNLAVKQLTISETNVHVQFTGSRIVQSRDFKVE